jgi:hypothetical protein
MGGQYRLWAGGGLVLRDGGWILVLGRGVEVWEEDDKILGWDSYIFCSIYN